MGSVKGRLYTADIICYGTPSPVAFQSYLGLLEHHSGKAATSYSHRGHGIPVGGAAFVEYEDGTREQGTTVSESWDRAWYGNLVRESCFRCGYHNIVRPGDVTMGDYWGVKEIIPEFEDAWGVSCLFANNERGLNLLRSIASNLMLLRTAVSDAANPSQPMLSHPPVSSDKSPFWMALYSGGFAAAGRTIGALGGKRLFKDTVHAVFAGIKGIGSSITHTAANLDEEFPMIDFDAIESRGKYPVVFAAKNRDDEVRRKSSSGGMFHALASHMIEELDGVVYGCAFDDKLRAVHVRCATMSEAERCMGSKYSQSEMGETIPLVVADLEAGRNVLFTGTPCQVDAVRTACARLRGGVFS